jgi:hypothetical protein
MKKKSWANQIMLYLIILIIIRTVFKYVLFDKKVDLYGIIFAVPVIILVWIYFNYYENHIKEASQSVVTQHPILYILFMILIFAIIATLGLIFIYVFEGKAITFGLIIVCSFNVLMAIFLYLLMKLKMKK